MRYILFGWFLLVVTMIQAQSYKKLALAARDAKGENFVLFKTGERKLIHSIKLVAGQSDKVKIEFADGSKEKYDDDDIAEAQDEDAFYKASAKHYDGRAKKWITYLSERLVHGAYDVFYLDRVGTVVMGRFIPGQRYAQDPITNEIIHLDNSMKSIELLGTRLKKSNSATEIIEKIKSDQGKLRATGTTVDNLMKAVQAYNADAAAGKLSE